MNLTAMLTAVRRRAGLPSTDSLGADADLTDLINEALAYVSTITDWPWLEATENWSVVAGDGSHASPTGWVRTRSLRISGYDALEYKSPGEIEYLSPDDTVRGMPRYYTVSSDTITLRPFSDAAYTIIHVFEKSEPLLVSGSDTPLMPAWAHYSVIEKAVALYHFRNRDDARGEGAEKRAKEWIAQMQDNKRRVTAPSMVRTRPGSWV